MDILPGFRNDPLAELFTEQNALKCPPILNRQLQTSQGVPLRK